MGLAVAVCVSPGVAVGAVVGVKPAVTVCVAEELGTTGGGRGQGSHCQGEAPVPTPFATGRSAVRAERMKSETGAYAGLMHVALQPNHPPRAPAAESRAETETPTSMSKANIWDEVGPPAKKPASKMMGIDTGAQTRCTTVLKRAEMLRELA